MEQQKEKTELLQQIFENTNVWLHFAEAKNGALIAFNVALIAGIMSFDLVKDCLFLTVVIIMGLLLSTIAAMWSFKPVNKKLAKSAGKNILENLLHFAYIATLEQDEYLQMLYARYWGKPDVNISSIPQLEKDYCEEIIENARITVRKQKWFEIGFYIVLFMLAALGVLVICA